MKLVLEDGTEYLTVDDSAIAEALAKLDAVENTFAILMVNDTATMQAAIQERGLYALEYTDDTGRQYESAVMVTLSQVSLGFQKFARQDRSFLRDFRWEPLAASDPEDAE